MSTKPDARLVSVLAKVPLFGECTPRQLRELARSGKILTKRPGATVVSENRSGVAFFVILDGTVDVERNGEIVATLEAGDFFGEMALLLDAPRNATVTAKSAVQLFALSQWVFKSLMKSDAHIAYNVARAAAARG